MKSLRSIGLAAAGAVAFLGLGLSQVEAAGKPIYSPPYNVEVFVRGSFNGWGLGHEMTFDAVDNQYVAYVELTSGGHEFKIASADWATVDLGAADDGIVQLGQPEPIKQVSNNNLYLEVADAAVYSFKFDVSDPDHLTVLVEYARKGGDDVSFEVPRGEVFGFIGPNGAGKTTSMRILATLELPTYGDAYIDGFSCINDPDRVRRRLGFMPDYFGTYTDVNCYEYLDFFARSYGLAGRQRHQALQHTMGFTKLDELAHKPIRGLSKGMKQRLCLGRAMIHDPAVLILDEPANGLDPRARIELREMIRELAANGKTVLVSSHILTELAEMCDRVGIIERGQLLAVGTVEEIQREQQPHREVKVRVLGGAEVARQWLSARSDINHVTVTGEELKFSHPGDRDCEVQLLKEMILADFRVAEFASHSQSLEDVFMSVTRGVVQ